MTTATLDGPALAELRTRGTLADPHPLDRTGTDGP